MNFLLLFFGGILSVSTCNYISNNFINIPNQKIENIIDNVVDNYIDNEINELMNIEIHDLNKEIYFIIYID